MLTKVSCHGILIEESVLADLIEVRVRVKNLILSLNKEVLWLEVSFKSLLTKDFLISRWLFLDLGGFMINDSF